jgi:hypothetical protein
LYAASAGAKVAVTFPNNLLPRLLCLQVGVAMSLFILFDPLITSDEYKAHCVFYMALMAFATVLINGSTAKYVLKWLGLLRMTPQQVQVLEHVLQVRSSKTAGMNFTENLQQLRTVHSEAEKAWPTAKHVLQVRSSCCEFNHQGMTLP